MWDELFIAACALVLIPLYRWCFTHLPGERWQFIAAIPAHKSQDGRWEGMNLTYYGAILATSTVIGALFLMILLGSLGQPRFMTLGVLLLLLLICVPSAEIVAMLVERKHHVLTVGGACFVGMTIAPPLILAMGKFVAAPMGISLEVMPTIAALLIAYAMGEGIGRLACISFGCCYGKPISECSPWLRRAVGKRAVTFEGSTKKAAYASGFEGRPLLPIQAVTGSLYAFLALAAAYLFLKGFFVSAMVAALLTQVWRFVSEFFRADYRGGGRVSAYQMMALITCCYLCAAALIFPSAQTSSTDILGGLVSVWDPGTILIMFMVWVVVFIRTGVSRVTGSTLSFHIVPGRT